MAARCPIEPSWILSERPDLYGLAVVQTDYTRKGRFVCHDTYFTERRRAALFNLPTDELSLKLYALGDG